MFGELIYSCKVLCIRELQSYIVVLTFVNICETKLRNLVWFIYSKPKCICNDILL